MRDFLGFRFGNVHSDDLHLKVVSSSDRYDKNLLPEPKDYSQDIPGGDGQYYWGQTYSTREFTVNVAFEDLDEQTWRRISQIFSTDKPQDLVFDENPYKTYKAKLKSAPDFKFVCFKDRDTGKRIYKGEGTLNFICYHPLAFCYNKYVVRAADYYRCINPEDIINKTSIDVNPYRRAGATKTLTNLIKEHYNTKQNMNTPWKGGYPTIAQVQNGELYFEKDDVKTLITDVRGYWDNIPKWEDTAKLLTTPTLDYDQELIYLPQYCRNHYYNMDIGLTNSNALIGSRLLVYNPGDVPVDFELRLGHLASTMAGNPNGTFRISRYNVQRLTIDQAVDWAGLKIKTLRRRNNDSEQISDADYDEDLDKKYKYGTQYFTILDVEEGEDINLPVENPLKYSHPNHCYYVEPIPQEHLAHFIKLFYWQTNLLLGEGTLDYEEAVSFANRYEELRAGCINEDERNELYWITLRVAILDKYKTIKNTFEDDEEFEQFVNDYLNIGPEYLRSAADQNYGEFIFNLTRMPQWYTYDYMDITTEDFNKLAEYSDNYCPLENEQYTQDRLNPTLPLFFNTETRMLYGIQDPEWENSNEFKSMHPEKEKNFFNYKPQKLVLNKNIVRGHWFQLPPGWSLIDISPLSDEKDWGGKRWTDARQFDWGRKQEGYQEYFNKIYKYTAIEFLKKYYPDKLKGKDINNLTICDIDELLNFRRWFEDKNYTDCAAPYNSRTFSQYNTAAPAQGDYSSNLKNSFKFEFNRYKTEKAEYQFLKMLKEYWEADQEHSDYNTGSINDWWWYASNYTWENFPPLYLGWVDLLNEAQIKYIPQFY